MCKLSFALGSNESLDQTNFQITRNIFRSGGDTFLGISQNNFYGVPLDPLLLTFFTILSFWSCQYEFRECSSDVLSCALGGT